MTYHKEVWISCDGDGCVVDGPSAGETAQEAREYARDAGWECRGVEDLCPECKEETNA